MNDSANSSAVEEQDVVVDLKTVCDRELEEISLRRERAFDRRDDEPEIRQSLVGLALSGGGVRSAAFSLGILQGLHRHGVLRFIDYLSTVSGGGYAGAFLSSVALHPQSTNPDGTESEHMFPIADVDGKQSPRMLRFIHGGRYLRKTGIFINRYLTGLFLIWLLVASALMTAAALVTYLFRSLDTPAGSDWATALGFKGDVLRALFPSFVLFVLWAVFWGISYFKFGRHATGNVARFFFYLLVASLLVAVAALLGTGDISFSGGSSTGFSTTFKTLLFGSIAASLLPYLTPQRLIRSGTNPKHVGEKYIFWLTTRALAYGVPFLFVAFFARENISHYNDYRDDRLVRSDVKSWDATSPIWAPLMNSEQKIESGNIWLSSADFASAIQNDPLAALAKDHPLIGRMANSGKPANGDSLWKHYAIPEKLATLSLQELQTFREELKPAANEPGEPAVTATREQEWRALSAALRVMVEFEIQRRWERLLAAAELDSDKLRAEKTEILNAKGELKRPKQYAVVTLPNRWCHFVVYVGEWILRDKSAASENLTCKIVQARKARREAQNQAIAAMNREVVKADFYKTFLPTTLFGDEADDTEVEEVEESTKVTTDDTQGVTRSEKIKRVEDKSASALAAVEFERVSANHPDVSAEMWLATLRDLRRQAESIEKSIPSLTVLDSTADIDETKQLVVARDAQDRAVYGVNRKILKAYYGNAIDDRSVVYASVVLEYDQQTRWNWFLGSLLTFLIASVLVDLNATSWHGFYSQRIASMWIERTPGLPKGLPLAQLETTDVGRPYHLLTGAVHIRRMHDGAEFTTKRDRFLFSKLYCGCPSTGYSETGRYMDGECTLEDAVAVSGAAVSPVQTDNPLILGLLFLFNIRLGQWMLNPGRSRTLPKLIQRLASSVPFTPLRYFYNRLQDIEKRAYCFVTDGGHYENLGIESLLKRRCRLIIAADAGQDGDFVFADLTRLIRKSKLEDGVSFVPLGREEIPLELEKLVPDPQTRLSRGQFLVFKIRYPEKNAPCGYLAYIKPTLTGDEPFELRQFHRTQEHFPHDPTSDQFYDADRFDAYRALGSHIGDALCGTMNGSNLAELDARKFIERFVRGCGFREEVETEDDSAVGEIRQVLADLRSKDEAKHELARQRLKQLGTGSFVAMPDLLNALCDEQWYVKHQITSLLYDYPREALPRLVEVLQETDQEAWKLQIEAAGVVLEYGSGPYDLDLSPAIAPLIRLSKESPQVAARVAAVKTLAVIGKDNPEAKRALKDSETDPSKKVQAASKVHARRANSEMA